MDLLKEIGAILGFVAFGGLVVLVFMTFQQARHVRRLREWAGRSPERSAIEAERSGAAAAEAAGAELPERAFEEEEERGPGFFDRMRGEFAYRWEEADRRSPIDLKIILVALLAVLIGVGVVTSGFGLLGGSDQPATTQAGAGKGGKGPGGGGEEKPPETKVAVLNGTAPEGGVGVPGVADAAAGLVDGSNGFKVGEVTDAPSSFTVSIVMYKDGFEEDAQTLATDLEPQLGTTEIQPMDSAVESVVGRADLALIIGQDDQTLATG